VGCILAVTVIFNVWGFPFVSMIPVIGDEVLGLSPSQIGYVASIEGMMSLVSVVLIGLYAHPRFYRRLYYGGVVVHLMAVGFIGLAPGLWALCLGLAVAGFAISGFAAMQATLIYMVAPPGMRGRYLGLISICIGAGLVGFANVGLMAELFGAQNALAIIAGEGLLAILVLGILWRDLRSEAERLQAIR
jgi:predicted MFS family arabinose efflux permease